MNFRVAGAGGSSCALKCADGAAYRVADAIFNDKDMSSHFHREQHRRQHGGWLRAVVLGANDGIVSTASLIVGVAASSASLDAVLIAGVAALVAGAMSMAAGEYVSVSSQADSERADLERERRELATDPAHELDELTAIYVNRGVEPQLARQISVQMTEKDALGAHLRDELGITEETTARPLQAAAASAGSFAIGAALPLLVAAFGVREQLVVAVIGSSLLSLALLGALAARVGGAATLPAVLRVTVWGAAAMALTALIGALSGTIAA